MKVVIIGMTGTRSELFCTDDAMAEAGHAKLKAAMEKFRKYDFGNRDQDETITIDWGIGETTYRVGDMMCVGIEDSEKARADIIARELFHRQMRDEIDALCPVPKTS